LIHSAGLPFTPPERYNLDDAIQGLQLRLFLNDRYDDCVIAARAHHTIRLIYSPVHPILDISDDEVSAEYLAETGGNDNGLRLHDSLSRWQTDGWKAGGVSQRRITGFRGPLSLDGSGAAAGDPTLDTDQQGIQRAIVEHAGVQAELLLPDGIRQSYKTTYGPGTLWDDISDWGTQRHVMLLTGFDQDGPVGITWGQRQKLSWRFLKKYSRGMYWIEKGEST
jgi:hypothetical protein